MNFKCLFVVTFLSITIGHNALAQTSDFKSKYDLALNTSNSISSNKTGANSSSVVVKKKNTTGYLAQSSSLRPGNLYSPSTKNSFYFPDDIAYRWYIQAGAGAQLLMAEDDDKGKFADRISFAPALTFGYRWNPTFGVRLNLTGGSLHGYNDGHSGTYRFWKGKSEEFKINYAKEHGFYDAHGIDQIERWDPRWGYEGWTLSKTGGLDPNFPNAQIHYDRNKGAEGYHWIPGRESNWAVEQQFYFQHVRYVAAHAAITMNLINLFRIDETRKFDATMFVGPTYFHVFPHHGVEAYDGFGWNGGIQGQYHLNEKIGFFLELSGAVMPDGFDGHYGKKTFDLVGQSIAGITYKFPAERMRQPSRPIIIDDNMKAELDSIRKKQVPEIEFEDLQPEIDRLRAMLEGLGTTKTEIIEPEKKDFFLPDPVHFEINKSVIRQSEWDAIDKAAEYMKKYPTVTVILTGYADRETGTAAINERLSRERSQAVADALVNKYGIERSRISTDWRGDTVQPFSINNLNRAVLFRMLFKEKK